MPFQQCLQLTVIITQQAAHLIHFHLYSIKRLLLVNKEVYRYAGYEGGLGIYLEYNWRDGAI